jgi:methionyl aminopeptidase
MREAGRLAAEVLQMIGAAREAGRHHRGARPHLPRPHREGAEGDSGQRRLQGLPEDHLHLGQQRHLPRHPERGKVLKDGDIINIDVTVIKDGWHGDTSRMYYVGTPR